MKRCPLFGESFIVGSDIHTHSHIQAELGGKTGLVPSNFLGELTPPRNDGVEIYAADDESMKIAEQILQKVRTYVVVLVSVPAV